MDPSVVDRIRPGDHVCWTFDDEHQRLAAITGYVKAGAGANQKILYLSDASPDLLLRELTDNGVDAWRLVRTGQLQMGHPRDGYLTNGLFDPMVVLDDWQREIAVARGGGYTALRLIGDMSWARADVVGADPLHWYEAQVNRVFADGYAMALCLYDRRLFDQVSLLRVSAAHPSRMEPGTDWNWRPLLRMERTGEPPGLRLIGEADASNRDALAATLADVIDDMSRSDATVTLDVAGLRFADAGAARLLMGAATTAPPKVRITGCSVPLAKLMRLLGGEPCAGAVA
ncbi:MEDS domain-containing protein [Sphaerisporangium sp. NPDC005289]|uniref:MEDS domain-containing protein n=1 Tax=Sphaerisporangium sp. NPDC005289 TaxID=3155247 RepID=UPI0033BB33F5